ncbi:flagellar basal body L-ring protein FlgH [Rheinheimera soli]|uniref:Flagellar L-ring protein n=1 Tax=Rheinheimera soli TaxID=443616 RepID=A0ABU1VTZ2_9GAMM|nr:flagellar basal body L-ring protein FlgH [Rheinheimera soli]MDR7119191.1 flagellar L-ring protein precursor FlgH [Rheinheimera soli]
MNKLILVVLTLQLCVGCAGSFNEPMPDDPNFAPLPPEPEAVPLSNNGSLFAQGLSNGLYSDNKARRPGDIITVVLRENTQATKKAKTEFGKDSSASFDPMIGLGGRDVSVLGNTLQFGANSASDFKGDSKADQSNSLVGDISVNVLRVMANGNLVIRGEKWLTLNTGREFIRLTGVIRAEDIDSKNTVQSTKIANARIEYSGTGATHNGQGPGWLTRFFTGVLSPF